MEKKMEGCLLFPEQLVPAAQSRVPNADVGLCTQLIVTGNEDDSLSLLSC